MIYAEYGLIDMGYADPDTGEALPNIDGRDNNRPGQRFIHLGTSGYPTGYAWMAERDGACLAAFESAASDGGTVVADADVPDRLMSDYGWPEGTTLGEDGIPVPGGEAA